MNSKFPNFEAIDIAKSIDIKALPWVLYTDKKLLPTYGGIYSIGTDQKPALYIGQTECLKTRHIRHHRREAFEQLLKEKGHENIKIRYWKAPPRPKHELTLLLLQVETYLIKNLKPPLNNTANSSPKRPSSSIRRTYQGPIYVQLNQLSKYYVYRPEDGTTGFYFSAVKQHMAENAVKFHSPAFMISSGTWEDALCEYQKVKPEWKQYSTLYFLEARFRARRIEYIGGDGREEFALMGDQASFYEIFLNELSGFKEFAIQYLRTGLINCSDSDFCETLLEITKKLREVNADQHPVVPERI